MTADKEAEDHLTDGRKKWEWRSRYPKTAWVFVLIEIFYLSLLTFVFLFVLYELSAASHKAAHIQILNSLPNPVVDWLAVFSGGVCGGCAFALKWLYHGVAHGRWHVDRIVWRYVVPLLSGVLALFTGLMISAGIVPIFNDRLIDGTRAGAAFGFFAGFFSDNVLAALQRIADHTLGTLGTNDERGGGRDEHTRS